MSLKFYRLCGVCGTRAEDLAFYKRGWVRVMAPDSSMNFKEGSYTFWQQYGRDIDVCSSYCLETILEKMQAEEGDIV